MKETHLQESMISCGDRDEVNSAIQNSESKRNIAWIGTGKKAQHHQKKPCHVILEQMVRYADRSSDGAVNPVPRHLS